MSIMTLTFFNRVHPLVIVNMSAKFDEEAHNGLVSIVFTRSKCDTHTEPQQRYYIPSATHCVGDKKEANEELLSATDVITLTLKY